MFLTTPKCGSSYLKSFSLLNLSNVKNKYINHYELISNEELGINAWRKNNPITFEDLNDPTIQKFQLTRNPYERLTSFFKHKILYPIVVSNHPYSLKENFEMFITTLDSSNESKIYKNIPPDTFIEIHEHLYPQYHWLFSKYFEPIDLNDLENKLQDIFPSSILPSKNSFTHHNNNVWRNNSQPLDLYSQETSDRVYNLYRDDFDKFNYER